MREPKIPKATFCCTENFVVFFIYVQIENAAFPETEAQVKVYADTTAKSMWDAGEKWVDYIQDIVQVGQYH